MEEIAMELFTLGIDFREDDLSSGCARQIRRGACAQEVHTEAAADLDRQPADMPHRIRVLFRRSPSRSRFTSAGTRGQADRSTVRQAIREVEQERLR